MAKKLFLVFVIAFLLRIWHLPELATFRYDEARDAIAEQQILDGHLTLLGPESLIGDKTVYFGPLHYYLMAPALKAADGNPLGPYFFTALLGAVTAVLLAAFFSPGAGLLYAVFPIAVIYNRWAWNPNTIPLFITLALIFRKHKRFFLAGVMAGLATQLHWLAGLFMVVLLFNPAAWVGFLVGLSPIIVFDIRHQFLIAKSLLNLFGGVSGRGFTWHYFLWLVPVLAIKFPKKILILGSLAATVVWLAVQKPFYPLNPFYIRQQAEIIADDQKANPDLNFNVVNFYGGDFRATNLRYFLSLEKVRPLGPEKYDVADHLYVVAPDSPLYNGVYEVASFKPKSISKTWSIGETNIYKLERS